MLKKMIKSCLAAAMVCAMAVPANAASDWSFYGSTRVSTFQTNYSKEMSATGEAYSNMDLGLHGNSRIGAKVSNGDVSGRFEYGHGNNNAGLRLLFGTWKTGSGTLTVGQAWTPTTLFGPSNQVYGGDANLYNVGGLLTGRHPSIQFSMPMGLKIAAIAPKTVGPTGLTDDFKVVTTPLPKLEVSYKFATGGFSVQAAYGMNSVKSSSATTSVTTSSSVMNVLVKMKFGSIWAGLDVNSTTNPGNYGMFRYDAPPKASYDADTESLTNASSSGIAFAAGTSLSDSMGIEAGYGTSTEKTGVTGDTDDVTTTTYVQLPIKLAPGVTVVPEVGTYDLAKDTNDVAEGSFSYLGAKVQINF